MTVTSTGANVAVNGALIRETRKLKGVNLTRFAGEVGIGASYLSHIERGTRPTVSPEVFAKLCNALGVAEHERRGLLATARKGQP